MQQHSREYDEKYVLLCICGSFWSERYTTQIKYIFCAAFVDFVSFDVTFVSSLKRFKKLFSFVFYILLRILKCGNNIVVGKN